MRYSHTLLIFDVILIDSWMFCLEKTILPVESTHIILFWCNARQNKPSKHWTFITPLMISIQALSTKYSYSLKGGNQRRPIFKLYQNWNKLFGTNLWFKIIHVLKTPRLQSFNN